MRPRSRWWPSPQRASACSPSGALSSFSYEPDDPSGPTLFENGEGGRLRARDPLTGALRFEVEMAAGRALADGASTFVGAEDGNVVAVDSGTGAIRWRVATEARGNLTPVEVAGGVLVVAGDRARDD